MRARAFVSGANNQPTERDFDARIKSIKSVAYCVRAIFLYIMREGVGISPVERISQFFLEAKKRLSPFNKGSAPPPNDETKRGDRIFASEDCVWTQRVIFLKDFSRRTAGSCEEATLRRGRFPQKIYARFVSLFPRHREHGGLRNARFCGDAGDVR